MLFKVHTKSSWQLYEISIFIISILQMKLLRQFPQEHYSIQAPSLRHESWCSGCHKDPCDHLFSPDFRHCGCGFSSLLLSLSLGLYPGSWKHLVVSTQLYTPMWINWVVICPGSKQKHIYYNEEGSSTISPLMFPGIFLTKYYLSSWELWLWYSFLWDDSLAIAGSLEKISVLKTE